MKPRSPPSSILACKLWFQRKPELRSPSWLVEPSSGRAYGSIMRGSLFTSSLVRTFICGPGIDHELCDLASSAISPSVAVQGLPEVPLLMHAKLNIARNETTGENRVRELRTVELSASSLANENGTHHCTYCTTRHNLKESAIVPHKRLEP